VRGPGREQPVAPAPAAPTRAEVLDNLSLHLGAFFDPVALVAWLADRLADRFGGCTIWLGDHGWLGDDRDLRRVAIREPATGFPGPDQLGPAKIGWGGQTPIAKAHRLGDLQVVAERPRATGGTAWSTVAVPLLAGGSAVGVLAVGADRDLATEEVSLALAIGVRAGRALANTLRFQRQRAMLDGLTGPTVPPGLEVPGLDVEADLRRRRLAGAGGTTWYDAIELDDGLLFFSLGEVVDRDPAAPVLMAQVRAAMRAYAVDYPSPATVLTGLDRLFDVLREHRPVTAVAGVADPATGEVWLANAGHAPPLLVPAAGPTTRVDAARSTPLGSGSRTERPEHRLVLRRGDTLLVVSAHRPGGDTANLLAASGLGPPEAVPLDRWVTGLTAAIMDASPEGTDEGDAVALAVRYRGDRRRPRVELPGDRALGDRAPDDGARPTVGRLAPRLQVPSQATSVPAARRWVADHLADLPGDLVDTAALLTSELVTNAVLHAGTDIMLSIHRGDRRVRVDVADGNPVGPVVKDYGPAAATGRGLTLLDRLASSWGTRPIIPRGKVVWFELPVGVPGEVAETGALPFHLDDWSDPMVAFPARPDRTVGRGPMVPIRLLGVPVAALNRASEQYDALFREFRLVVGQGPANPGGAPERLIALIDQLGTRFARFNAEVDEQWRAALDRGDATVDLSLSLPLEVGEACEHYDHLFDQADHFCRAAELITLPATAEAVALRKWFLLEFARQAAGSPPVPWADSTWAAGLEVDPPRPGPFAPIRHTRPPNR